jgi:hypothetical protein
VLTPKQWLKNKWNFQRMKWWFDEKMTEENFCFGAKQVKTLTVFRDSKCLTIDGACGEFEFCPFISSCFQ